MTSARTALSPRARLGAQLARRREPVQQRARKTVELILDTAAALIEEIGVEAFNTNVLAERAGVRVRTVYRYFPNKLAVLTAVAERLAAEWDGWFDGFRALADPRAGWRTLWVAYVDKFVQGIRSVPGGLAIRRAMRALPELQAIDRQDNERLARELAAALGSPP
jgi:AcrR family transcriptional regulator